MTRDTHRPVVVDGGLGGLRSGSSSDLDTLAGLWEEARFARLPCDAPSELEDLVIGISNPKKVYAVHKASRRHNFQLLVQKYIVQLREGCGAENCLTSTCFTCRKRIVGRAPIRRFNTTSARTLATFLASQDNAENGLCPALRLPKTPPAALNSLIFTPSSKVPPLPKGQATEGHAASPRVTATGAPPKPVRSRSATTNCVLKDDHAQRPNRGPGFSITEEPVSKDYRSFAANVFGTVAFKMLEWLAPASVEDMSRRAKSFHPEHSGNGHVIESVPDPQAKPESDPSHNVPKNTHESPARAASCEKSAKHQESAEHEKIRKQGRRSSTRSEKGAKEDHQQRVPQTFPLPSRRQRRNSDAKVRTPFGPRAKRPLPIDPFASETLADEPYSGLLKSPRAVNGHSERLPRGIKATSSTLARPISQLSSSGFFDDVTLEKMPPNVTEIKPNLARAQLDGAINSDISGLNGSVVGSGVHSGRHCNNVSGDTRDLDDDYDSEDEDLLPETLWRLNPDVVDFICDIIQEDGTAEEHMLEPPSITKFHTTYTGQGKAPRRKPPQGRAYMTNMKLEWKMFVDQTLYYILSDPGSAITSFTKNSQLCDSHNSPLYDSQTLWYCMLRMTRIAPSLVFHSLWVAAASLFAPPESLQSLRSPTAKLFPRHEKSLSNAEAGKFMSICLHALVAAAPLVTNSRELYDMSRIRSHGLSLAGSGSVAQQPVDLCLQYEDCFTNDLALRLARRLFTAITTRRYFDELKQSIFSQTDEDVLSPLFSQLDFLNMDAVYILNFSFSDRALHEARVPIILLDWARAVMLNDWDGSPEIRGDGAFGGALALIEAMYNKRHELLLGDAQFRSEYFADRLDSVQMPVSWLSHTSTRQRLHLLDFPYIFNPATLVTYFRSINFSRMSRAFEESTSLQERIEVIASRSSLDQHHKDVLTERLKTAASKYLILDIRRNDVVQDAFDQLWRREERELLRPLKVHLGEVDGEEGFDSGGVQQEFFRLAIAEALNPVFGAFTVDERTRMAWFVPGSLEPAWKFELVGLIVSLAIYNGLTLPLTFPRALYRKILNEPVTELHHIADGWPDLASGLTALLEWDEKDGLVEDVFARTYEFSVSVFGQHITREMKPLPSSSSLFVPQEDESWPQFSKAAPPPQTNNPGADDAPLVTNANRNAYVSDYIRYLTDVSVRPQYEAFARGFRACLHPKSLSLLSSGLLQSLVEGVQEIDINELRRYTRYVGWDASHRTVRDFWSIVRRYDDGMKRKLLEFVTASDRVPVGGVKNMMFIMQKNGAEDTPSGRLPTSYTCYGTLLLPEYRDKETLRERLAMALENAQGFGFA
ncbi:hypothetical protein B0T17DRAFT_589015 [Bombardia bombarda]|uniref:HECT-type E3 ubiquitin transferase n=1 Tax=Bombardia bombarda TaxID=252184 RepID=A0AA39X8W2_9PEZI|nr:hypothetical protein B0T17DRAFT_589015 [Bombardia bombarda]